MSAVPAAQTAPMVAIRRLAVARAISTTGSLAAYAALIDLMFRITDGSSVYLAATVMLTIGAVGLLEPFGGWIADRMDRRVALIGSDLAGAVAFVAMAFVGEPGLLLALAFLSAVAETPFRAGSVAAVPALMGDESMLAKANGWIGMGTNIGITVGPALGGLLAGSDRCRARLPAQRRVVRGVLRARLVDSTAPSGPRRPTTRKSTTRSVASGSCSAIG